MNQTLMCSAFLKVNLRTVEASFENAKKDLKEEVLHVYLLSDRRTVCIPHRPREEEEMINVKVENILFCISVIVLTLHYMHVTKGMESEHFDDDEARLQRRRNQGWQTNFRMVSMLCPPNIHKVNPYSVL